MSSYGNRWHEDAYPDEGGGFPGNEFGNFGGRMHGDNFRYRGIDGGHDGPLRYNHFEDAGGRPGRYALFEGPFNEDTYHPLGGAYELGRIYGEYDDKRGGWELLVESFPRPNEGGHTTP